MSDGPEDIATVLVIRLSALGDVANVLPAVRALRRELPDARITWLAEQPSAGLVQLAGIADEIVIFPRKRLAFLWKRPWLWLRAVKDTSRFLKQLRAAKCDYALDFQGNLKSGVLGLLSGTAQRIGFARGYSREMNWLLNNVLAAPTSKRLLRAEKNAALAQTLAPDLELEPTPLAGTQADARQVEAFLAGIPGDGPVVVLHPGASAFADFKRWPPERFGALAARLKAAHRARCVITQGPNEEKLAGQVVRASDASASPAPQLGLGPLVELFRRVQLVIAGDTGPLHIAAVMQRPVVAIFGPKDPAMYAPWTDRSIIVRKDIECSPCTRRRCDHVRCIEEITVEDVFAAADRLLKAGTT